MFTNLNEMLNESSGEEYNRLVELEYHVQSFFKLLDHTETNDDGVKSHPIKVTCGNVFMSHELREALVQMRKKSLSEEEV